MGTRPTGDIVVVGLVIVTGDVYFHLGERKHNLLYFGHPKSKPPSKRKWGVLAKVGADCNRGQNAKVGSNRKGGVKTQRG